MTRSPDCMIFLFIYTFNVYFVYAVYIYISLAWKKTKKMSFSERFEDDERIYEKIIFDEFHKRMKQLYYVYYKCHNAIRCISEI